MKNEMIRIYDGMKLIGELDERYIPNLFGSNNGEKIIDGLEYEGYYTLIGENPLTNNATIHMIFKSLDQHLEELEERSTYERIQEPPAGYFDTDVPF